MSLGKDQISIQYLQVLTSATASKATNYLENQKYNDLPTTTCHGIPSLDAYLF